MILSQKENLVEVVEDSPDFWSEPVQSYNSPVDRSATHPYKNIENLHLTSHAL